MRRLAGIAAAAVLGIGVIGSSGPLLGAAAGPVHVAVDGETIFIPAGVTVAIVSGTPAPSASPEVSPSSPTSSTTPSPTATPTSSSTSTPTPSPSASTAPTPTPAPSATPPPSGGFILIGQAKLASLPTSGAAWSGVLNQASKTPNIDLSNLDADGDVVTLAKALVCARVGDRCAEVRSALVEVQSSSVARALELARGLGAYVLAADLIGYRDPAFVAWVGKQRSRAVTGGPASLDICATQRPNNWGTWCRSSRLIVDLYLGDSADRDFSIKLFRGWLGDRGQYSAFVYGDVTWQCDSAKPVGINPACSKSGHEIGGVLPDDQRRAGSFSWPPPCENYVAEAMQGVTLEATVLARLGQPAWSWSDSAIRRAAEFKYANGCPFVGDDDSVPWLLDSAYGTNHHGAAPSTPGKGWGFADWWAQ